jgi:hypothetical protein
MTNAAASYYFATDLVGFRSAAGVPATTLRVRVTERRDGYVWCRTADLLDAGTPLVLADRQVREVAR